jgi:hypothetical protein
MARSAPAGAPIGVAVADGSIRIVGSTCVGGTGALVEVAAIVLVGGGGGVRVGGGSSTTGWAVDVAAGRAGVADTST